jgi:hypothetical protein
MGGVYAAQRGVSREAVVTGEGSRGGGGGAVAGGVSKKHAPYACRVSIFPVRQSIVLYAVFPIIDA